MTDVNPYRTAGEPSVSRRIAYDGRRFFVGNDPDGVLATALSIATAVPSFVLDESDPSWRYLDYRAGWMTRDESRDDRWIVTRKADALGPQASMVIDDDELRELIDRAAVLRRTVPRQPRRRPIAMDDRGSFQVGDDPRGVIAEALVVATTGENISQIATALAPDGDGFYVPTFGGISRAESRDDIPDELAHDESLRPEIDELWILFREPDNRTKRPPLRMMIHGDELRELVAVAVVLRSTWRVT